MCEHTNLTKVRTTIHFVISYVSYVRTYCKDTLFPIFCLGCKQEGIIVCTDCAQKIGTDGIFLPVSSDPNFLASHSALSIYQEDSLLAKLIHEFKYNYHEESMTVFSFLFQEFLQKNPHAFVNIDFIVPIPLHPRRFAERGFNQSELLARMMSDILHIPLLHALKRTHSTRPQAQLSGAERQKNVAQAFEATSLVAGKNILVVDDVYTTGSTMQECARALKEHGAAQVRGFTLARAII